jgi:hypothetical protein
MNIVSNTTFSELDVQWTQMTFSERAQVHLFDIFIEMMVFFGSRKLCLDYMCVCLKPWYLRTKIHSEPAISEPSFRFLMFPVFSILHICSKVLGLYV